jgi:adenosylmethionine-8-amino-7-oxononanoate aminotransferase
MTGFGRTGRTFGIEHWDAAPDLMITGKALGAGFASIAAVCVHDKVIEAIRAGSGRFDHNFTMAGNPLACAVASAVIDAYEAEDVVANARDVGEVFIRELRSLERHSVVGEVRGRGLMVGIELCSPGSRDPLPPELHAAQLLDEMCREEALLVYPCSGIIDGARGDAILLLPPLVLSSGEAHQIADRLDRALARFTKSIGSRA